MRYKSTKINHIYQWRSKASSSVGDTPPPPIAAYVNIFRSLNPISIQLSPLLSIIAGVVSVLGFAPFGYYLLPLVAIMWLFWVWHDASPAVAFRHGWLFGLGLMGFGVTWLRNSISQFGGVDATMATVATLGFVMVAAMYFGLTGWLGCKFSKNPALRLAIIMPTSWGLVEWLRGWFLTGFPWLAMGYAQIDSPLRGYAPILGVYGVSWLLTLSAGLALLGLMHWETRLKLAILWLSLAMLPWIGGLVLTYLSWSVPTGLPFTASLVQPSIPQTMKWDPMRRIPTLKTYRDMTRQASGTLIIWPETAIPDFLHRVQSEWLQPLVAELALRQAQLLVGAPVLDTDGENYYNGAVLVGANNSAYYKQHLVPFGEYLPLRPWLGVVLKFLRIPMSNFTPGTAIPTMKIGSYSAGISICYEDAFGGEIIAALPEANYLINISNDAWFGDSLAPHQHLEIARMRALETGRYLIRATNSGISAIIDQNGVVQTASALFAAVVLSGQVQPMIGATPFVTWGDSLVVMLWLLTLLLVLLLAKKPVSLTTIYTARG